MVIDVAPSIGSARSRARINALLVDTSLIQGAFRAHHTLWATSRRRTNISGQTRANGLSVNLSALTVGTTGTRLARIDILLYRCSEGGKTQCMIEQSFANNRYSEKQCMGKGSGKVDRSYFVCFVEVVQKQGGSAEIYDCRTKLGRVKQGHKHATGEEVGKGFLTFSLLNVTISERISFVSGETGTRGQVIDDLAVSILTTGSWARVLTFVPNASPVRRAVRIEHTLWTASFVSVSKMILNTCACSSTVLFPTLSVGSAWARITRVQYWDILCKFGNQTFRCSFVIIPLFYKFM